MKKFLITLHIITNSKKITAIKDLRAATGMGLVQAKNFVETYIDGYVDSFGGQLICNGDQVAALYILDRNSYNESFHDDTPSYSITAIKALADGALDVSNLT